MKTKAEPIGINQRITLLDTLRGFAIFGILMVNMPIFYKPVSTMMVGIDPNKDLLNTISYILIKLLFEGKFYVIFSMLFGYGFWIFMNKSVENGNSIIPIYRRRVFILLLFGIFHIVFLWAGDILTFYAIFGFVILLFRKRSDKGLIKWAIGFALIPIILALASWGAIALASLTPESKAAVDASLKTSTEGFKTLIQQATIAYSEGSFGQIVSIRLQEYATLLPGILFFYPTVMAMFLVGMWAARKNLITNYFEHIPFFRKALIWGLAIGIPSSTLYVFSWFNGQMNVPSLWSTISTSMHIVSGIAIGISYVSAIALFFNKQKSGNPLIKLSYVGRMALTNYLMHSVICTTLFLSYGFGLFGKVEVWQGMLLTIVIFVMQVPLSNFWIKRYHYGPFEWIWRSLTYGKRQPFKR